MEDLFRQLEHVAFFVRILLFLVSTTCFFVGALSVLSPSQSIKLYQLMMRWFNWRVEPIDLDKELRNTRWLGAFLLILATVSLGILFMRGRWGWFALLIYPRRPLDSSQPQKTLHLSERKVLVLIPREFLVFRLRMWKSKKHDLRGHRKSPSLQGLWQIGRGSNTAFHFA